MYFRFMAAVSDLSLAQMSGSFQICYTALPDLINVKIDLEIVSEAITMYNCINFQLRSYSTCANRLFTYL